jgi:hypothetical protein
MLCRPNAADHVTLCAHESARICANRDVMFGTGVFFAATIPFVFVLVVGLVGISRINEQIDSIPGRKSLHYAHIHSTRCPYWNRHIIRLLYVAVLCLICVWVPNIC